MDSDSIFRRLRGALGNAVVWGAIWFATALAISSVLGLVEGSFSWAETWRQAARIGVMGGLASAAFSTAIGLLYRGKRLSEISWVRFGLGGGAVAGVIVPLIMLVGRTVSGDGPLPLENWVTSALVAAAFGTVAAGGTMKLAQRVVALPPGKGQDRLEP